MQLEPEAFADMVIQTVDAALVSVLQRLAASEAKLQMLGDVRDRVVTMEAKSAAAPAIVTPHELEALRQSLVVEIEKRSTAAADGIAGVRERVSAIESKVTDVTIPNTRAEPVSEAILATIADLRERVAVAEVFSRQPGPAGPAGVNGLDGKDGAPGKDGLSGKDGADGLPGKDGVDGVSLDDLSVVQEDERTLIVRGTVGAKVKDIGRVTFPVDIYRGVWIEGKRYEHGDSTTWAGSEWHCNRPTFAKPGDGSKDWTLKVKKGRDGRDGKDAPGLPMVSIGGRK